MPSLYKKELAAALEAVQRSEQTFRKYFRTRTKVEKKHGNYRDLVSYADKKIESDIHSYLLKKFPSHGFIGEEGGNVRQDARYVWVADPIDGTSNYLQGVKSCGICLAMLEYKKPVVGVVSAPMLGELYAACNGGGATVNGVHIRASRTRSIAQAFGAFGWGRNRSLGKSLAAKLLSEVFKLRVLGSSALSLCYVACGTYDFAVQADMNLWDYAAAQVVLEEAGGKLIQVEGRAHAIAANPLLAAKLKKFLGGNEYRDLDIV